MSTITINPKDIVRRDLSNFAPYLTAFQECSTEIQAIAIEMAAIITDEESSNEERTHAVDALVEALCPMITADVLSVVEDQMKSGESVAIRDELKLEEDTFAAKIRQLMTDRGWTQEELAERTGVSQPAISNILNRECRPQLRTITRFAEAFEMDAEELWPSLKDG